MTVTGKARVAGVMGWPVAHSKSPTIHGYWLDRHGIDGAYVPFAVRPEDAEAAFRALPKLGFAGSNVTLPHKLTAFRTADVLDAAAKAIGAVNLVVVQADGSLLGANTDAPGLLAHLRSVAPGWRAGVAPAAVFGAGGGARAALFALLEAGAPEVRIANRTRDKAEVLKAAFGARVTVVDWAERAAMLAGVGLAINTTSLGMIGQPPLEIALDDLPTAAVVYDIVYAPLETDLLAEARRRGNQGVDGLGMLLHQAAPSFQAFFGLLPEVDGRLREIVLGEAA